MQIIGHYGIRPTGPHSVWIAITFGPGMYEGGQFSRAALNAALFPGELRDLFTGIPADRNMAELEDKLDTFYCENF